MDGAQQVPAFRYSRRRRSASARVTAAGWLLIFVAFAAVALGALVVARGVTADIQGNWGAPSAALEGPASPTVTATATATRTPSRATRGTTPTLPPPVTPTPTLSPSPTATPTVTPTPTPAHPVVVVRTRGGVNANLRAGPGTGYPVTGTAMDGETLPVLARAGDWFQVRAGGGLEAWVWGELLDRERLDAVPTAPYPTHAAPGSDASASGGSGDAAANSPLDVTWAFVGVPAVDGVNAYHTVYLDVRGGVPPYRAWRDGAPLSGPTFVLAWVRCGGQVTTTVRVEDSVGWPVERVIGFNAFCPTPFGCVDCRLWSP